ETFGVKPHFLTLCLNQKLRPHTSTHPKDARDNAEKITQKVENIGIDTVTWDYTYDLMGRLETVYKDSMLAEAYSYDGNGNRLSENNVLRGITRSYTHSIEDHVITAGADSYSFDVDGFLISRTVGANTDTFNYSSRGELLSVSLASGNQITYDHDPLGRRIAKRVNGTITEKYLWQDSTTLLAVYDASDTLIQRFSYADGRMPVSMTYQGSVYYLTFDQVGSLRTVTDSTGANVKRIDYDSFGNIISDSNPSFTVPLGFAGGLHDRDTGLVRFGARDYDPAIGKWTAKDPIDFAGGDLNLMSYVGQQTVGSVPAFHTFLNRMMILEI
ncbi:MAG: RHS repeat domain-containing protein, partial [bacterium]